MVKMKKLSKFLASFLLVVNSFGFNVRIGDTDEPLLYGRNDSGTTFDLFIESSGDGTVKSSPFVGYMPWALPASPKAEHFRISNLGGKDSTNGGLVFDLELTKDSRSDLELFIAARISSSSDTEFVILKQMSLSTPFVSLDEICNQETELDCDALEANSYGNNVTKNAYFYVFLADEDDGLLIGDQVDPTSTAYGNGIYYRIYFSNNLSTYDTPSTYINSQTLSRGDKSLYLNYKGAINDSMVTRVGVFGGTSSSLPDLDTYHSIYKNAAESNEILIKDLTNGVEYCFGARYIDKYGFKSPTNVTLSGDNCKTPIEIEQLLKEKSCYLVTAGFKRDHYVLEYFRYIRDHYLLKTWVGSSFVELYYSTAPKYAPFIYNSKTLSNMIKVSSYFIYFLLNNVYKCFLFLILGFAFLLKAKTYRREMRWKKEY